MPAPTNTSAATATNLGPLPNTITQRVDDSGTTYEVWFHYVALVTGVIGIFALGDLAVYKPSIQVWSGTPGTLTPVPPSFGIFAVNQPVQIPVVGGTDYFFQITPNGGNPAPANLNISGQLAPIADVPTGSIFVNDDTDDFPLALLSAIDGSVLRFVTPFPASEAADVLNDGTIAVEDDVAGNVAVYSSALVLLGAFGTTNGAIISTNKTTKFYIGSRGGGAVQASAKTMTPAGVFGPTIGPFGSAGLTGMAPSPDETILYFTGFAGSINAPIKRWDILGNVGLSDLAPGNGAGYASGDLQVLSDGSVVALFHKVTGGTDTVVVRYSAAGALLNTYNYGTANNGGTGPRICRAIDDPNSFWIWLHRSTGFSTFINVKAGDGTALATLNALEFEAGVSQEALTLTPAARFGHSFSCPFLIMREGIVPPEPPPPPCIPPTDVSIGCANDLPLAPSSGGLGCSTDVPTSPLMEVAA